MKIAPIDINQVKKTSESTPEEIQRQKLRKSAEEFESVFLNMVFKNMRQTISKSKLIDGGNAEDIYRSMLDSEYANLLSSKNTTGLADKIEQQLLQKMGKKIQVEIPNKNAYDFQQLGATPLQRK